MTDIDESKYYVFYDGDCGFCNYWVQWILKKDKKDQFRFSALQSGFGQQFLWKRNLKRDQLDTLYLWKPNSYYLIKSQAVTEISKLLGGKYGIIASLNFLPAFLTDKIYDLIAAKRKNLPQAPCSLPTEEQRKKFIE